MKYEDIIDLPHHTSKTRPRMSMENRAAQFAPFAALTGHSAAVDEVARVTDKKVELDEYTKEEINQNLIEMMEDLKQGNEVHATLVYFRPDNKKSGGAYVEVGGQVNKIDVYKHVVMISGEEIPIDDILECTIEKNNLF